MQQVPEPPRQCCGWRVRIGSSSRQRCSTHWTTCELSDRKGRRRGTLCCARCGTLPIVRGPAKNRPDLAKSRPVATNLGANFAEFGPTSAKFEPASKNANLGRLRLTSAKRGPTSSTFWLTSSSLGRCSSKLGQICPPSRNFRPEVDQHRPNCDRTSGNPSAEGYLERKDHAEGIEAHCARPSHTMGQAPPPIDYDLR